MITEQTIQSGKKSFFSKEINFFLFIAGLGLVMAYLIYLWFPEYTPLIIEEDSLVENLSVFIFLLAGILGLWAIRKNRNWKKLSLGVAGLGFLGFLDEISFGERVFDFSYPSAMNWQIDSAHDLVAVAYRFFESIFGYYGLIALVVGTVIAVIAIYLYQQKYSLIDLIGNTHKTLPGKYLILFSIFLAVAVLVDLKEHTASRAVIEEMLEMYAAIALCFYSIRLPSTETATKASTQPPPAANKKAPVNKSQEIDDE